MNPIAGGIQGIRDVGALESALAQPYRESRLRCFVGGTSYLCESCRLNEYVNERIEMT